MIDAGFRQETRAGTVSGGLGGIAPLLVALNRRYSLPMGDVMLVINGVIVALSGMRGDLKSVLYRLAAMFVTGKTIDLLTAGTEPTRPPLWRCWTPIRSRGASGLTTRWRSRWREESSRFPHRRLDARGCF
jgi:hypothetical protein